MANQIVVSAGAKVRNLQDVIIGTSGVLTSLGFDVANGVPRLDVNGKILVSQLPNSVMEYKGTWNAATNTPTLVNGTGNQGDVYLCNVAGTVDFGAGPIAFVVGDQVIYSGSIWQRASGATGTVTSVAVTETGDSLNITGSPITTSGTINIGFNGTNLQYVNGAGNLTTFPILTGYVTAVSGTAPVVSSGGTTPAISMAAATSSVDGYLTSADFTTFNNKQNAITLTTTGTSGASTLVGATLNIPNYGSALTSYVPYTGATANVDLGTFNLTADVITGATGSFASNGGSDTFAINHSSGAGIALNITKGGSGEGLYINKTSGSGNAATIIGTLNATTLVKSGGTSSQFLKADGTVDSSTYALDSAVVHNTGNETVGGTKTFSDATKNNGGIFLQNASSNSLAGYMNLGGLTNGVKFTSGGGISNSFTLPSATGYTFTFPNATGTIALTSDISYPVTSVFGRTGAVVATSGDYTTAQVTESGNLYFTDSRARLALSFVAGSGAYNSTTGVITIPTNNNQITNGSNYITLGSLSAGTGISYNNTTGVITNSAPDQVVALTASTGISVTGTYPNFTITNTSPSSGGTVTSVAALTIGTSGTDLSSTVATSTTTPVITLNVPTASAANRGALSSADWTTFNGKQAALSGTGFVKISGTTISYDNSTYLTTSSAASTYLPLAGGTLTGALGGTSASFSGNISTATEYRLNNFSFSRVAIYDGGGGFAGGYNFNINGGTPQHDSTGALSAYYYQSGGVISFYTNSSQASGTAAALRMTLNSSGNLGLGVTPSAWNTIQPVFQIGYTAFSAYSNVQAIYSSNAVYTSGWKYLSNTNATYYSQNETAAGVHAWFNAPSGTAGNAITFTQAMTLTAAGRLLIGTPTEATYMLDVNGTGRFSGTLNVTNSSGNTLVLSKGTGAGIQFNKTNATAQSWQLNGEGSKFYVYDETAATTPFQIAASTGAATFSSSVTAANSITVTASANTIAPQFVMSQTGGNTYSAIGINRADGTGIAAGLGSALVLRSGDASDSPIQFATANNVRMTISATGNVGIGTSSPLVIAAGYTTLTTDGTSGSAIMLRGGGTGSLQLFADGTNGYVDNGSTGAIIFRTTSSFTERMRITSGGRVVINNASGSDGYLYVKNLAANAYNSTAYNGTGANIRLETTGATTGITTGIAFGVGGAAEAYIGAVQNSSTYADIVFQTYAGSYGERMRITSGGDVEIASGSIKTGTPSGGTAKPWKLGQDTSTLYSATRTIQVEIDGGTYYLLAVKSTDL
jgi:hypothetical protein